MVLSMGSMPTIVLLLKTEGNTHVKNGKFLAAIEWQVESQEAQLLSHPSEQGLLTTLQLR